MSHPPKIHVSHKDHDFKIQLEGEWRSVHMKAMEQSLASIQVPAKSSLTVLLSSLEILDTVGAYLVLKFLKDLEAKDISYALKKGSPATMATLKNIKKYQDSIEKKPPTPKSFFLSDFLGDLGKNTVQNIKTFIQFLSFLGEIIVIMDGLIRHPSKIRFVTLVDLIHKVGVSALPIVGLISFLIGIVLVYQGADQLRRFGAEIFTINLLVVSALRELGILLTAIVVAGRSGSAYTAQLGFMKLNQEVDALQVLGFNTFEVLVIPRILALMIALPLLTFFSDIMALIGGGVTSYFLLGIGPADFCQHMLLSLKPWTFWVGVIKAPFFAFFIALISCFEGMRVSGGAERVGHHTTQAVVESIFLVLVLDALFSIVFSYIGI
ncbi:MAG: MlaE family ABC transporter permease [Janthinobacterium lividum]